MAHFLCNYVINHAFWVFVILKYQMSKLFIIFILPPPDRHFHWKNLQTNKSRNRSLRCTMTRHFIALYKFHWPWPCFQGHQDHGKISHLKLLKVAQTVIFGFGRFLPWLKMHLLNNSKTWTKNHLATTTTCLNRPLNISSFLFHTLTFCLMRPPV